VFFSLFTSSNALRSVFGQVAELIDKLLVGWGGLHDLLTGFLLLDVVELVSLVGAWGWLFLQVLALMWKCLLKIGGRKEKKERKREVTREGGRKNSLGPMVAQKTPFPPSLANPRSCRQC
jgi:hypothetical protein